jgi:hypothetical protein
VDSSAIWAAGWGMQHEARWCHVSRLAGLGRLVLPVRGFGVPRRLREAPSTNVRRWRPPRTGQLRQKSQDGRRRSLGRSGRFCRTVSRSSDSDPLALSLRWRSCVSPWSRTFIGNELLSPNAGLIVHLPLLRSIPLRRLGTR